MMDLPPHPGGPATASGNGGPGRFVVTLFIGCMMNAPLMAARLVLPLIAALMGGSPAFVGVIASLFTAAPIFLNVPFGRWVDRSGTLIPSGFALLLIFVATLAAVVNLQAATLVLAAVLIGSGAVFGHIATIRAIGDAGNIDQRSRNLGILIAAYSVFQFAGPLAAGATLESFGAQWSLAVLGGFALTGFLALSLPWHHFARWSRDASVPQIRSGTRALLRWPGLARWLTVGAVMHGSVSIYPFIVAIQAIEIGLSATQAGVALGAFAIGNMLARTICGLFNTWVAANIPLAAMLCAGSLLYAALPAIQSFQGFCVLSGLIGFALGMGAPFILAALYSAAPEGRVNETIGLSMVVTNVIQTALPLWLGVMAVGIGSSAISWSLAALMALTTVLALRR